VVSAVAEPARSGTVAVRGRGVAVTLAVLAIVALDQLTKVWVVAAFSDSPLHIFGNTVMFAVSRNSGSAFSRFRGFTPLLAIAAVVVAVFLVRAVRRATDRVLLVGLVLVLGGALGNLVDRFVRSPGILRGHVVDFIAVGSFPVFNVADSCITIGAIILVVRTLFPPSAARADG
jgi:signal peptidase II